MASSVGILCLSDPADAVHGGTIRTAGLYELLAGLGHDPVYLHPRNPVGERVRKLSPSSSTKAAISAKPSLIGKIGDIKREYLPMPIALGARDMSLVADVKKLNPDLLIVTSLSLLQFTKSVNTHVWLDFMDVWSSFGEREARNRRGLARLTAHIQANLIASSEKKAATRSTLITAAGWDDKALLNSKGIDAHWLPPWLASGSAGPHRPTAKKQIAGFIGNFDYWPNRDAYELLIQKWAPKLNAYGWEVLVAGRKSAELRKAPGVRLLGEVPSVEEFYSRVSITLAPIRLGGGIKVKVIESLLRGLPVIGTDISAEGLSPETRRLVTICSDEGPSEGDLRRLTTQEHNENLLRPYTRAGAEESLSHLLKHTGLSLD